jgi:Glypican
LVSKKPDLKQCCFIPESLLSLTDRLTGPFNIEQIVLQLDISISDAIMNFQVSIPQKLIFFVANGVAK